MYVSLLKWEQRSVQFLKKINLSFVKQYSSNFARMLELKSLTTLNTS